MAGSIVALVAAQVAPTESLRIALAGQLRDRLVVLSRSEALLAAPDPAVDDQRKPRRSPGKPRTEGEGESKPTRRPAKKAEEVKPDAKPEAAVAAPKVPVKRVRKAPAKADGVESAAKEGKE